MGGGPGYPLGNNVRLESRVILRMKEGDKKRCSRYGRSLSRKGVMEDAVIESVERKIVEA
jgi:hypothetical protein